MNGVLVRPGYRALLVKNLSFSGYRQFVGAILANIVVSLGKNWKGKEKEKRVALKKLEIQKTTGTASKCCTMKKYRRHV